MIILENMAEFQRLIFCYLFYTFNAKSLALPFPLPHGNEDIWPKVEHYFQRDEKND